MVAVAGINGYDYSSYVEEGFMSILNDNHDERHEAAGEEPPPLLGSWNRLYAAIVIYTCVMILALYLMTRTLNR
jgi:hypothetical protein